MIAEKPEAHDIQLVLMDIGNTSVSLATWSRDGRSDVEHLPAAPVDAVIEALRACWTSLPAGSTRAVVISSVCPPLLDPVRRACTADKIEPLLIIGETLMPPIGADVPDPSKVGADRLCAAAAAFDRCKGACVVADFGTALTVDLVADNNVFLGGTILPGMSLSARALHEHTALLPLVDVKPTREALGKDTQSAIVNGISAMMTGALREIAERYATEIGKWPPLIATGGDAPAIAETCDFIDSVVPDLVLDGLVLAFQQFASRENPDE